MSTTTEDTSTIHDAAQFAMPFEGERLMVYRDPAGIPTIGYGSIWDWRTLPKSRVTMATPPINHAMAGYWLGLEMTEAAQAIARDVDVPLSRAQKVALIDFAYNLGTGAFRSSTLLRKLNAGDYEGAAAELLRWDMAGGKHLPGLLRRRQAEKDLFLGTTT